MVDMASVKMMILIFASLWRTRSLQVTSPRRRKTGLPELLWRVGVYSCWVTDITRGTCTTRESYCSIEELVGLMCCCSVEEQRHLKAEQARCMLLYYDFVMILWRTRSL